MRASAQFVRQLIHPVQVSRRLIVTTQLTATAVQESAQNGYYLHHFTTQHKTSYTKKRNLPVVIRRNVDKYFSTQTQVQDHVTFIEEFSGQILETSSSSSSSASYEKQISILHILPAQYLREIDPSNYNTTTGQRIDVYKENDDSLPYEKFNDNRIESISIKDCSYNSINKTYHVLWNDGRESIYPYKLIVDSIYAWKGDCRNIENNNDDQSTITQRKQRQQRQYWSNLSESKVRSDLSIPFMDLICNDSYQKHALQLLYEYGVLIVSNTPVDNTYAPGAVAVLASVFGGSSNKKNNKSSLLYNYHQGNYTDVTLPYGTDGPLQTLYSTVWSTTIESTVQGNGSSYADSAYTNDSLPLHTDLTYHLSPPGLQLFTMQLPSTYGGESIFCDGFAIGEQIRQQDYNAFYTLSNIKRTYRSIDTTTGWNLQASGPIISLTSSRGQNTIQSIRHNDLDRLPDLPPLSMTCTNEINSFYSQLQSAHTLWNKLLNDNTYRLQLSLQKGDTIVVANQRVLHGRIAFKPPRSIIGCYVSQDELDSRFRIEGYDV